MSSPLDELYFRWLYGLVADPDEVRVSRTYWKIMRQMFTKEFVWVVPNDDNRAEDGRYLRNEFIESLDLHDVDPDWMRLGCSVLEMIICVARHAAFADNDDVPGWFWHLIANLGIRYNDRNHFDPTQVDQVLDELIFRNYEYDGRGGLFPLRHSRYDQRQVELWYQMQSYLLEH